MIMRAMSRRIDDDARGPSGGCRDAMLRWMPDTVSLISDLASPDAAIRDC